MSETVAERLKRFDGDLDTVVNAVNTLEQQLTKVNETVSDSILKLTKQAESLVNQVSEINETQIDLVNKYTLLIEMHDTLVNQVNETRLTKVNNKVNSTENNETVSYNKVNRKTGRPQKVFVYKGRQLTYQDIASIRNISVSSVKIAVSKGILDPASEQSIAAYLKENQLDD